MYLFDPVTCEKKNITYKELEGITGISEKTLTSYKAKDRKIKCINCYIFDDSFKGKPLTKYLEKENMQDEVWRDIPNSKVQVSSYGRYRRLTKSGYKMMLVYKTFRKKRIRPQIRILLNDGTRTCNQAQDWVVKMFLGNRPKGMVILHKDGNIWNNRIDNLEYVTKSYAGRVTGPKTNRVKAVIKIDIETGEVLEEYESCAEAARDNYTNRESIRMAVKGKSKTSVGFKWAYAQEVHGGDKR